MHLIFLIKIFNYLKLSCFNNQLCFLISPPRSGQTPIEIFLSEYFKKINIDEKYSDNPKYFYEFKKFYREKIDYMTNFNKKWLNNNYTVLYKDELINSPLAFLEKLFKELDKHDLFNKTIAENIMKNIKINPKTIEIKKENLNYLKKNLVFIND